MVEHETEYLGSTDAAVNIVSQIKPYRPFN